MPKNAQTITQLLISHASNVMLKILQVRLQQYMNHELPNVQAGCIKGRGTRDQIVNIHWTIGRRQWHPPPVLLPGKSHGQRSQIDYSPWGRKELDTTERLHFHFPLLL